MFAFALIGDKQRSKAVGLMTILRSVAPRTPSLGVPIAQPSTALHHNLGPGTMMMGAPGLRLTHSKSSRRQVDSLGWTSCVVTTLASI